MLRLLVVLADKEVHEASCASRTCSWSAANTRSLQLWASRSSIVNGLLRGPGSSPCFVTATGRLHRDRLVRLSYIGCAGRYTFDSSASRHVQTNVNRALCDGGHWVSTSPLPSSSPSSLASPPPGPPSKAPLPPLQSVHKLLWVTAESRSDRADGKFCERAAANWRALFRLTSRII